MNDLPDLPLHGPPGELRARILAALPERPPRAARAGGGAWAAVVIAGAASLLLAVALLLPTTGVERARSAGAVERGRVIVELIASRWAGKGDVDAKAGPPGADGAGDVRRVFLGGSFPGGGRPGDRWRGSVDNRS